MLCPPTQALAEILIQISESDSAPIVLTHKIKCLPDEFEEHALIMYESKVWPFFGKHGWQSEVSSDIWYKVYSTDVIPPFSIV